MAARPRILLQLDTDDQPSSFDAVVAIDSGVDHLLSYPRVRPDNVEPLIHGGMFTRGPDSLHGTAVFIGGSQVDVGEEILDKVLATFFGPLRMSVMVDGNGSNTTAAAAVVAAGRHVQWPETTALVLGGTGPVGSRIAQLLVHEGAQVLLGSRSLDRAQKSIERLVAKLGPDVRQRVRPAIATEEQAWRQQVDQAGAVFACGAAGVQLLSSDLLQQATHLRVAVDLNAVPPAGLEGIEPIDFGVQRGDRFDYGALGVGGLKMKIHRRALASLFEANDRVLNTQSIYELGLQLGAEATHSGS
ncbi:MAG: MtdA bifunctional protein [Pirellulaceae bacterium]|nr:MAG: MtdA bifunctional protein [Pirellulaceae bacterium]